MSVMTRNAVTVRGSGTRPMIFLHGYGCDQNMWRYIAPHFDQTHRIVLYDHVGSGKSDLSAYDKIRYANLHAYADDLIEVIEACDITGVDVVGHSVGCMIAILAAKMRPDLFGRLMLLGPSPCYIDQGDYVGGFTREGIEEMLAFLALNPAGWSAHIATLAMSNPDRPELAAELEAFFTRNEPEIMHHFAGVLFHSDHRSDIAAVTHPTLIMQCDDDIIAPLEVGDYMHAHMASSTLVVLPTHGHFPQLSHPEVVTQALIDYLASARQIAA